MARLIISSSSGYLTATVPSTPSTPLSIAVWGQPTASATSMCIMALASATAYQAILLRGDSSSQVQAASWDGTNFGESSTVPTAYVAGIWQHFGAVYTSPTLRQVYYNGVAFNNNTNNINQVNMTLARIGNDSVDPAPFNGLVTWGAIWTAALTSDEMALLAIGVEPSSIRPQSLLIYWPVTGIATPEIDLSGNFNFGTLVNGPVYADDPPFLARPTPEWFDRAINLAAASAVVFRRTLAQYGTRVGSRQRQSWGSD